MHYIHYVVTEVNYSRLRDPKILLNIEEVDEFCNIMLDPNNPTSHLFHLLDFLILCEELELYEYCSIIVKHVENYML